MSVSENITVIHERMAAAARRAGRQPEEVELMAVTKTFPASAIVEAYAAGQRLFGESRVQEFAAKASDLQGLKDAVWHMIGHLQSNKAAKAVELFAAVDSLDSFRLAQRLDDAARHQKKKVAALIEINVGGEAAKSGLRLASPELEQILRAAQQFEYLEIRGLMTVPPFTEDPEEARPYFRKLRELQKSISARQLPGITLGVLSMGMSHDFEAAIEEGSTRVRVGTAIFGQRV